MSTMMLNVVAGPAPGAISAATFKIMSWNMLAQCLVRRDLFPYIHPKASKTPLTSKLRLPKLIETIIGIQKPDVAALQEVDAGHWGDAIERALKEAGYDFVYTRKNPEKKGGHGVAIIWKRDMFSKVAVKEAQYDNHHLTHPTSILPISGNVFQIVALSLNSQPDVGIIVSNTHLYWRPTARYEKLRQIYVLREETRQFREELARKVDGKSKLALFICGDFNMLPSEKLYTLLTSREENIDESWFTKYEPPEPTPATQTSDDSTTVITETETSPPTKDILAHLSSHPTLVSAYSTYQSLATSGSFTWTGEPGYTTYTEFKGTLDYIFTEKDNSSGVTPRPLKVLKIPEAEVLEPGLPNWEYPSDHVPIMAEYSLDLTD
ncbi:hypothetical protein HDV05_006920 [Chytridiales sp. JEL 0842]|nr:hypothetical protein HDV05_006920 [Chytridiales sp. JEL 0842]